MRTAFFIALLVSCATPLAAFDVAANPSAPMYDSRIKLLRYDEGDVYTMMTRYGYQTNIVFDRNETIETISVGDRSVWQIIPAGHRMFIRPMTDGASTNMTVLTNKRSYQFDLKSTSSADENADIVYVAKFVYGDRQMPAALPPMPPMPPAQDAAPAMTPPPSEPLPAETTKPVSVQPVEMPPVSPDAKEGPGITQPVHPNYNYTYSGPDILAPLQVFDNGKSTFIRYNTLPQPLPEVFAVDAAGTEQLVAPEHKDRMLVVPTIASSLIIKQPQGTITIYNELLNPEQAQ